MSTPALTIAEILGLPALVPLWPTVGQALGLAQSTTYQLAAENRLPIEVIRLGGKRVARTTDLHRFLGLTAEDKADVPGYQPGTSDPAHDNAPGYQPGAPVQRIASPTS